MFVKEVEVWLASCSHWQMSGQWGEGCFFPACSDYDTSSKGLLKLWPTCSHQIPHTCLVGQDHTWD